MYTHTYMYLNNQNTSYTSPFTHVSQHTVHNRHTDIHVHSLIYRHPLKRRIIFVRARYTIFCALASLALSWHRNSRFFARVHTCGHSSLPRALTLHFFFIHSPLIAHVYMHQRRQRHSFKSLLFIKSFIDNKRSSVSDEHVLWKITLSFFFS